MANFFSPGGELLVPYDVQKLEQNVAAAGGVMKPGCKFRCTLYSREPRGTWSLPCVFRGRYVSLDEGMRIRYRVWPGALVWLLLALPVAALAVLVWLELSAELTGLCGALIGVVAFAFTFQRGKAIARFEEQFNQRRKKK